jgi:hypothetical protein
MMTACPYALVFSVLVYEIVRETGTLARQQRYPATRNLSYALQLIDVTQHFLACLIWMRCQGPQKFARTASFSLSSDH